MNEVLHGLKMKYFIQELYQRFLLHLVHLLLHLVHLLHPVHCVHYFNTLVLGMGEKSIFSIFYR